MFRTAVLVTSMLVASPSLAAPAPSGIESIPLIPREILFGNPERTGVDLSPDGSTISWIAPDEGVLNLWIAPADDLAAARVITRDRNRGIQDYFWMPSGTHLVYMQDRGGDENWRVYSVNITTGEEIDLTPLEGVAAQINHVSRDFPNTLAVGLNDRDPNWHDIHLIDTTTGERTLIFENTRFASVTLDDSMRVRMAEESNPDGSTSHFVIDGDAVLPFQTVPFEDAMTTAYVGLDRSGRRVFAIDSRDRNFAALTVTDLGTGHSEVIQEGTRSDISGALINPIDSTVEAVAETYLKREWTVHSPTVQRDFDYLRTLETGEFSVNARSDDDTRWIVAFRRDDGPSTMYLYDRAGRAATRLFSTSSRLEGLPLVSMHGVEITTRDGLVMPSYLSLPASSDADRTSRPSEPLPMVLLVHGGPWARDVWGYNPIHQWLANRGYAVLSPNFRGSTGFGKDFINASNGQWADAMRNDLLDAVEWAVENGIADRNRVAIMGGSYGGYAALAGLTFTPEVFAASVAIVAPSSLITLLESLPSYWQPLIGMLTARIADHRTPEGRRKLRDMSPLTHVDEIVRPLLIGQGANDPRVKQQESDQIVKAMQSRGLPVTYVLFPDEGHGFVKPENNIAFFAIAEAFLAEHIDGRSEPIDGEIPASSALVVSRGGLDLDVAETSWEELEAIQSAPIVFEEVAFEDLEPAQQSMVKQMLGQLDGLAPEMRQAVLADAIPQLESALRSATDEERPMYMHLLGVVRERIEAAGP